VLVISLSVELELALRILEMPDDRQLGREQGRPQSSGQPVTAAS
jgi:hypothetical protein